MATKRAGMMSAGGQLLAACLLCAAVVCVTSRDLATTQASDPVARARSLGDSKDTILFGQGLDINLKSKTVQLSVPKGNTGQELVAQLRGQKLPANGVAANSTALLSARFLSHTFNRATNMITFKIDSANLTKAPEGFGNYMKTAQAGGILAFPSKAVRSGSPPKNITLSMAEAPMRMAATGPNITAPANLRAPFKLNAKSADSIQCEVLLYEHYFYQGAMRRWSGSMLHGISAGFLSDFNDVLSSFRINCWGRSDQLAAMQNIRFVTYDHASWHACGGRSAWWGLHCTQTSTQTYCGLHHAGLQWDLNDVASAFALTFDDAMFTWPNCLPGIYRWENNGVAIFDNAGLSKILLYMTDGCSGPRLAYHDQRNPACAIHDTCYYCSAIRGKSKDQCDDITIHKMHQICDRLYGAWWQWGDRQVCHWSTDATWWAFKSDFIHGQFTQGYRSGQTAIAQAAANPTKMICRTEVWRLLTGETWHYGWWNNPW